MDIFIILEFVVKAIFLIGAILYWASFIGCFFPRFYLAAFDAHIKHLIAAVSYSILFIVYIVKPYRPAFYFLLGVLFVANILLHITMSKDWNGLNRCDERSGKEVS